MTTVTLPREVMEHYIISQKHLDGLGLVGHRMPFDLPELKRLSDAEISDLWSETLDPRAFAHAIMDKLGVTK